ncbi:hypothetical protein EMPS_04019 [Entomortierella parvispora]|uniref:RING-type domain-containing protein n=1 Tax=Entomortierella parvispora TaxID=205924 RepID=A0A9P3H7P7_9FUNG|nr:hypothetical protein EMPS_04019 [Entomortierella parvispora]
MGAVSSSLADGADWLRHRHGAEDPSETRRRRLQRQRRRRRQQRLQQVQGSRSQGFEEQSGHSGTMGSAVLSEEDSDDYDSLDDGEDEDDDDDADILEEGEDADSTTDGRRQRRANKDPNGYDNHPLYFGPSFHPVTEQSPAQIQLHRQIEQQLEQQQRQEYWMQQSRQQQQQQNHYAQQQQQQQQQLSSHSAAGGQQLSLNDFILPSAISGMTGVTAGGGMSPSGGGSGGGDGVGFPDHMQDQLYRNNQLYNLISGLSVNPLLTEVQRAGTLDLSVLEQELDDVEGGWVDMDEEPENSDASDMYAQEGIVREMQPTKRSPTALACNINLKKNTLRLVKNFTISKDPTIPPPSHLRPNYRLDFSFDSLTPCDVKLFWVVKEVEEDGALGLRLRRLHHLPQPTTYHFPAGMNQRFISPILPLYTMSLPELTMQGLPSTTMRVFQKRQQQLRHQYQQQQNSNHGVFKDGIESHAGDDESQLPRSRNSSGRKAGSQTARRGRGSRNGSSIKTSHSDLKDGMKHSGGVSMSSGYDDDTYKAVMEDQYYPLVILIEATKSHDPSAPVRSLPMPEVDSPGLYLVNNQAISTFACFSISSEGGFEIKVMKQKVWINSTNYLIQEIYGFTDSIASPALPKAPNPAALPKTRDGKNVTRAMSRLSRAESIASRVTELTSDRPSTPSKKSRPLSQVSQSSEAVGSTSATATSAPSSGNTKRRSLLETVTSSLALRKAAMPTVDGQEDTSGQERRHSVVNMSVEELGISEPPVARRTSKSSRRSSVARRLSTDTSASGEPSFVVAQTADGDTDQQADENEDSAGVDTAEAKAEEEAVAPENLVLLDSPECVICLSEIKDTIVLPCRHFCMCSDCGDVLRRRPPQKCPICRQIFQSLLHIASSPTPGSESAISMSA